MTSPAARLLELPEIHTTRVEPAVGDWYGVCSCGARSLPCVTLHGAGKWTCPRDEAELEVLRGALHWRARLARAHVADT